MGCQLPAYAPPFRRRSSPARGACSCLSAEVRNRGGLGVNCVFRWDESASSSRGGAGFLGPLGVEGESGRKAAGDGNCLGKTPSPADGLGLVAPAATSIAGLGAGVQAVSVAWRLCIPRLSTLPLRPVPASGLRLLAV